MQVREMFQGETPNRGPVVSCLRWLTVAAAFASSASAIPITYTLTGTTATFDPSTLAVEINTATAFTLNIYADTANAAACPAPYTSFMCNVGSAADITFAGDSTWTFTDPMAVYFKADSFFRIGDFDDLAGWSWGVAGLALGGWDLVSDISYTFQASPAFANGEPFVTNVGSWELGECQNCAFTAVTSNSSAPEPGSLAMVVCVLGLVPLLLRKQRKQLGLLSCYHAITRP